MANTVKVTGAELAAIADAYVNRPSNPDTVREIVDCWLGYMKTLAAVGWYEQSELEMRQFPNASTADMRDVYRELAALGIHRLWDSSRKKAIDRTCQPFRTVDVDGVWVLTWAVKCFSCKCQIRCPTAGCDSTISVVPVKEGR